MENTNSPITTTTTENQDTNASSNTTNEQSGSNLKSIKIESVTKTSLKSSQEKSFRKLVMDSIPALKDIIEVIWPKKATLLYSRQKNYTNVYFINDEPCFLQIKDEAVVPHIKLLHKYPFLLPTCQVDKGAIPYIIGGANVMIPGMTSKGGVLPEVDAHSYVAILCEGKQTPLGIGRTTMSKGQMQRIGKGIGLELIAYIGDDNWNIK